MCRAQKCSDFAAAAKLDEVFLVQFSGRYSLKTVGVNDDEGPPVPIPNTEVKLARADNTWLETAREDRSTPTQTPVDNSQPVNIFLNSSVGRACGC